MEGSQSDWETLLELEETVARWLLQGSALAYSLPWSSLETQSEEEEEDEDIPAVSCQIVEVEGPVFLVMEGQCTVRRFNEGAVQGLVGVF